MRRAAILLALCLSGCAAVAPGHYVKPEERAQYGRDDYQCEYDSRQLRGPQCDQLDNYRKCMRSKGWVEDAATGREGMCKRHYL